MHTTANAQITIYTQSCLVVTLAIPTASIFFLFFIVLLCVQQRLHSIQISLRFDLQLQGAISERTHCPNQTEEKRNKTNPPFTCQGEKMERMRESPWDVSPADLPSMNKKNRPLVGFD